MNFGVCAARSYYLQNQPMPTLAMRPATPLDADLTLHFAREWAT